MFILLFKRFRPPSGIQLREIEKSFRHAIIPGSVPRLGEEHVNKAIADCREPDEDLASHKHYSPPTYDRISHGRAGEHAGPILSRL